MARHRHAPDPGAVLAALCFSAIPVLIGLVWYMSTRPKPLRVDRTPCPFDGPAWRGEVPDPRPASPVGFYKIDLRRAMAPDLISRGLLSGLSSNAVAELLGTRQMVLRKGSPPDPVEFSYKLWVNDSPLGPDAEDLWIHFDTEGRVHEYGASFRIDGNWVDMRKGP